MRRALVVGIIVVLTVLGWLLADGTGSPGTVTPPVARPSSSSAPTLATDPEKGLGWVEPAALPAQARTTIGLIEAGGPYPYAKDGVVFGNRERLLPRQPSGYYHEYTVPTPGSGDHGARRIISGDGGRQLFYTDDHYASFRRIRR